MWHTGMGTPQPTTQPAAAAAAATQPPLQAVTLADFRVVDDSLVFPRGAGPEIKNVTMPEPGTFRCELRHRGNPWSPLNPRGQVGAWYDGDRDLEFNEGRRDGKYHDKSRAEMSGLFGIGRPPNDLLVPGTTWDIATTVLLDKAFVPSLGYCNIMQPVFDQSFLTLTGIKGDAVTAKLQVFEDGIGSIVRTARTFTITRGQWTPIVVRIAFSDKGGYWCSVRGDPFVGLPMDTTRGRRPFSPKWGLYMTATTGTDRKPLGDSIVTHRDVYVRRVA